MKALATLFLLASPALLHAGPGLPAKDATQSTVTATRKKTVAPAKEGLQPDGSRIIGRNEMAHAHTVADALRRHPEISLGRW